MPWVAYYLNAFGRIASRAGRKALSHSRDGIDRRWQIHQRHRQAAVDAEARLGLSPLGFLCVVASVGLKHQGQFSDLVGHVIDVAAKGLQCVDNVAGQRVVRQDAQDGDKGFIVRH
jgi:hypothetical protein